MAYRNDRTERARLYRKWVIDLDLPCAKCGSRVNREIAHIIPYYQGGETTEDNCRVLCRLCNLAEHPSSKFLMGDTVRVNGRTPAYLDFTDYEKTRPRTIISIRYDTVKLCNFYTLGSNGKGKMNDGQPLEGYAYEFRSYQLKPYLARNYHFRRRYTRHETSSTKAEVLKSSFQSQEIVAK